MIELDVKWKDRRVRIRVAPAAIFAIAHVALPVLLEVAHLFGTRWPG